VGSLGVFRFLFFWFAGTGQGHIQSLTMSGVLLIIGFQVWMLGIVADLISVNRRLSEEILYLEKKREMSPYKVAAVPGKTGEATSILEESKKRRLTGVSRFRDP